MAEPTKINDELSVCGQISLKDIGTFAHDGYATILNNRPDNEEPGQLDHNTAATEAGKHGIAYQYQPIVTSAISLRDVTEFQKLLQHKDKPILAHCRSGTRCYLVYALTRTLFEGASPLKLVAEAAAKGYDIRALPMLTERLEAEK
jgi:uncharacterized protein (TIGR01244 family)